MLKRLHHYYLLLWHITTLQSVDSLLATYPAHSGPI
jgi:hypothetical protein